MRQHKILPAIAAALLAAAAGPAAAQQAAAQTVAAAPNSYKIGFVDTDRMMRTAKSSLKVVQEMHDEFERRTKEIEAGPPADIERRKRALADEMNMRREFAVKQIVDKANELLRRIAETEKYDAVFFEAAYASSRIDLTDRLVKALDAER